MTFYLDNINNMTGANPGNVREFPHVHYCIKYRTEYIAMTGFDSFDERINRGNNNASQLNIFHDRRVKIEA